MKRLFLISLTLVAAALSTLSADSRLSPMFMGSCNSNGMLLKGLDAATYNPALLSFSDCYKYSINLFPVNFSVESSVEKSLYDDYLAKTGDNSWSNSDKDKILDAIGDGLSLNVNAKTSLIGFQLGHEAYALNVYNHVSLYTPKDLWELIKGNEFNKSYQFEDAKAELYNMASAEYTFSDKLEIRALNKIFKEVTVGATFRYMFGFPVASFEDNDLIKFDSASTQRNENIYPAYMKISNVQGELYVSDITGSGSTATGATKILATYDVLVSEAGHGIGMDVGAAVKVTDDISCGISINNLISGISWYHNNKIYRYQKVLNGLFPNDVQESNNVMDEQRDRILDTLETDKFFTSIPAELNLGFAWHFKFANEQNLTWTAGYSQQFTDQTGATYIPKVSTGCEYVPVSWFKLRGGIMGGGASGFGSAIGFGFYAAHYAFDLGVEDKYLFGSGSKGAGIAIGQKFFW